ncbi:MAG: type II CAAX endopeptidase family protein [Candidatus Aquilonibacter sp.]
MQRFFAFPLVRIVLVVALFAIPVTAGRLFSRQAHGTWGNIALTWFLALSLFAIVALVERFAAGRSIAQIGFPRKNAVRDFALGLLIGAALFCAVIVQLAVTGHYHVDAVHVTSDLAIAALVFLPGAAIEELLFRGVLFRLLEEWSGTWIALAVSAALFGLAHLANRGATAESALAIALEAGVLLGLAYIATRSLWLPIGLHFAWNYCEGPIFGTSVSGHAVLASAVSAHVDGPAWLTGGAFGPEAGICAILTSLVASAAFLLYARRFPARSFDV